MIPAASAPYCKFMITGAGWLAKAFDA